MIPTTSQYYDGPELNTRPSDSPSPTWPLERRVQWAVDSFNKQVRPLLERKAEIHALYGKPRMPVSLFGAVVVMSALPDFAQRWLDILDQSVLEIERRVRQAAFLPT